MAGLPERNMVILGKVLEGHTLESVADSYGITLERVRQIVYRLCRTARKPLAFHFPEEEWECSLQFFRKNRSFIYRALGS